LDWSRLEQAWEQETSTDNTTVNLFYGASNNNAHTEMTLEQGEAVSAM
jgi:hypothetical protein